MAVRVDSDDESLPVPGPKSEKDTVPLLSGLLDQEGDARRNLPENRLGDLSLHLGQLERIDPGAQLLERQIRDVREQIGVPVLKSVTF